MNESIETLQDDCLERLVEQLGIAEAERDKHRALANRADRFCRLLSKPIAELRKALGIQADKKTKRCADKQEVLAIATDALREAGSMSVDELKRALAAKLEERGKNRSMSAKLLAECLRAEPFVVTETGRVELTRTEPRSQEGQNPHGTNRPRTAAVAQRATNAADRQASRQAATDR